MFVNALFSVTYGLKKTAKTGFEGRVFLDARRLERLDVRQKSLGPNHFNNLHKCSL
jgi:hypothetical protein